MTKVFYDELVGIEEIFVEIERVELNHKNKQKVKKVIDEIIHYRMVTFILDHLPRVHHKTFLIRFQAAPHEKEHLVFLEKKLSKAFIQDLEKHAQELKKEIQQEFKKYKYTK